MCFRKGGFDYCMTRIRYHVSLAVQCDPIRLFVHVAAGGIAPSTTYFLYYCNSLR